MTAVKKYPHAALAAMISIAAVVISAVTVLAVSIIGGMFLMYGEMRQNTATMRENQATMVQILQKQQTIENRQIDAGNIMRAYEMHNNEKLGVVISLLPPERQAAFYAWSKVHPAPKIPREDN